MQPGPASFFMGSREFTISGGHFTNNAYYGSENWNSDTSKVSIFPRHKFHNWGVVRARKNWTFNSAVMEKEGSGKSMSVFVQTFEGHGVKQLFANTLEFSRQLVNGHHLNIIGVSPSSDSKSDARYIIYERAHSRDTRRLLAAALVKGEKETTTMGLRTVYGITSALAHLSKVCSSIPLAQISVDDFDTFSDDSGHTVLCFTPNIVDIDKFEQPTGVTDRDRNDLHVCNLLIKKIFTEANHIIWREKVDRYALDWLSFGCSNSDNNNLGGHRDQSQGSAAELFLQASENDRESSSQPRRELRWKSLESNMPLSDISQVYEDFLLDSPFDMSPPVPELPRRLGRGTISHKCKGYRREEVTFTPDAFENTVVVFREPSLNEKCVLCGTLITIEESLLASPRILAGSGLPVKVKVKVHFHEDIFIIHVSRVIEYDELVKKVGRKIRLSGLRRGDGPMHVKYRDEGGDMILLGTTEDVQMAFEQCRPGRHLTLFVT